MISISTPGRFSSVGDQVVRIYFHGMEKDGLIDLRQDSQGSGESDVRPVHLTLLRL